MVRHTFLCPLRWSDMDALGHVNNVQYLRLIEEARADFFHDAESLDHDLDESFVVVRQEIEYKRQLHYRHEPLPIEMWISRISHASFTMGAELVDTIGEERVLYARAATVLATINLADGRPRRVSQLLRDYLTPYLAAPE
ncbi:MAG: thioesterase family protein [Nocardioidaceae bacterium]